MVVLAKGANVLPILCTLPPQPANTISAVPLNLQIRNIAKIQGVPLVDLYSVVADPSTGLYKAGYSPDGINPGSVAARLMAARAISATYQLYDHEYPYLPASENDGVNLIIDPLFLINTSPWTAGTVSGIALQNTVGTDPAIAGNTKVLTKTDTASANMLTGSAITTGFNPATG